MRADRTRSLTGVGMEERMEEGRTRTRKATVALGAVMGHSAGEKGG